MKTLCKLSFQAADRVHPEGASGAARVDGLEAPVHDAPAPVRTAGGGLRGDAATVQEVQVSLLAVARTPLPRTADGRVGYGFPSQTLCYNHLTRFCCYRRGPRDHRGGVREAPAADQAVHLPLVLLSVGKAEVDRQISRIYVAHKNFTLRTESHRIVYIHIHTEEEHHQDHVALECQQLREQLPRVYFSPGPGLSSHRILNSRTGWKCKHRLTSEYVIR